MPIRVVDKIVRLGRIQSAFSPLAADFAGTHVAPPARSGVLGAAVGALTGSLQGVFTPNAARSGLISAPIGTLAGSIAGTFRPAANADPTMLPLVQAQHVTLLGFINLPTTGDVFAYGGSSLAIHPDGQSLYVAGPINAPSLGRVSIPALGGTANLLQSPVSVPGEFTAGAEINYMSGVLAWNNRLLIQKIQFYANDTAGNCVKTANLSLGAQSASYRFANLPGGSSFAAGYMGVIPTAWRSLLGGPCFAGGGSVSIISVCNNGPFSFFAFDPDQVGVTSPVPTVPLCYYTLDNPSVPAISGSAGRITNDIWQVTDWPVAGAVFPEGTRSVLVFYKHGYGAYDYKGPNDPCDPSRGGSQAYPYRLQVAAYDANDLLAVKNGTKQPWQVQPYAWFALPGSWGQCPAFEFGACAWQPITNVPGVAGRVYVTMHYGGDTPRVYVFQVAAP